MLSRDEDSTCIMETGCDTLLLGEALLVQVDANLLENVVCHVVVLVVCDDICKQCQ